MDVHEISDWNDEKEMNVKEFYGEASFAESESQGTVLKEMDKISVN